jgi:ABC-type sugar transport system substrate-binding protein
MNQDEAVALIRELLLARDQEELQKLIGVHLPQMDNTFFAVLTEAAEVESARNPALGARLTSLAQTLLPLRTLI